MDSSSGHHDPMVAMICPDKNGDPATRLFHNQYMTTSGKWATDYDHSATCRTDKVEILEYCKKVRKSFIIMMLLPFRAVFLSKLKSVEGCDI